MQNTLIISKKKVYETLRTCSPCYAVPMPAAKLTPEQWAEVRRADEQGVDKDTLCRTWGITYNALRQRRHRENWLTPSRVRAEAVAQEAKRKARYLPPATGSRSETGPHVTTVTADLSALSVTAQNLNDKAHEGSLISASLFLNAIVAAANQGILPPQNGRELYTAMKGLRHAAGMDKEGLAINIGAFFGTNKAQARTERDISPTKPLIIAQH